MSRWNLIKCILRVMKVAILSMSCNDDRYAKERLIVKSTWGKKIIDGRYEDVSLWFFRKAKEDETCGLHPLNEYYGEILVKAGDGVKETYQKTREVFKCIEGLGFDAVVLTNTSTYINIKLLSDFVNSELYDNTKFYGGRLLCFGNKIPFFRGDYNIIPSKWVSIVVNSDDNGRGYNGTNDFDMAVCLSRSVGYGDWIDSLYELPCVEDFNGISINDTFRNAFYVRCKNEKNTDVTLLNMIGVSVMGENILSSGGFELTKPLPPKVCETPSGKIAYHKVPFEEI